MAGKPADTPPGAARHGETHIVEEETPSHERVGPLILERLRKDDGRALILYSSAEPRDT